MQYNNLVPKAITGVTIVPNFTYKNLSVQRIGKLIIVEGYVTGGSMTSGAQFFNGLPAPNNIVGRYVATTANGYGGVFYWAGGTWNFASDAPVSITGVNFGFSYIEA